MDESLDEFFTKEVPHEYDAYWNSLWNPMASLAAVKDWHNHDADEYHIDEEAIYNYNLKNLYKSIIEPNNPVLDIQEGISLKSKIVPKTEDQFSNNLKHPGPTFSENLEEELYEHFKFLTGLSSNVEEAREFLLEKIGSFENIELIQKNSNPSLAKTIILFANFWVNNPMSWKPGIKDVSLVVHLFSKYNSPVVLIDSPVEYRHNQIPFKWVCWYIIIGQGGSLKKAAPLFGWIIPSKFQHYLLKVPKDIQYPIQACVYAEVLRLGGNDVDFVRVAFNESLMIDPTERNHNEDYLVFWTTTMVWLITNRDRITNAESRMVLSWAVHLYTESRRDHATVFSWKGRGVVNTLNQASQYFEEINRRDWGNYKWNSHDWNWEHIDETDLQWTIEELTSSDELYEESMYMQHCVKTYSGRCISGTSAIFSLKLEGERKLTIEIAPQSKKVVQALGEFNRMAESREKEIVKLWAESVLDNQ
ncbi:PcfJ domain-containing protein [Arenibacter sp. ARW7G5Y1]|uniref:PcfJ domain-containing protein n=1 Tax=Arenibacter sp. ARW7G5Y1 TaxID=2135619 RepID=UPI0015E8E792|nr:PcfJ domain-containing protein [Arenibacter sp. ARW7G5Y1]